MLESLCNWGRGLTYAKNPVGINFERNGYFGSAARARRQAHEAKLAQHIIITGHRTLTLEDDNVDRILVIRSYGSG